MPDPSPAHLPRFRDFRLGDWKVTTLLAGSPRREDPHSIFGLNVDAETFAAASRAAGVTGRAPPSRCRRAAAAAARARTATPARRRIASGLRCGGAVAGLAFRLSLAAGPALPWQAHPTR